MQRFLLKFAIVVFIFTGIVVFPVNTSALMSIRSNVTVNTIPSSSKSSIKESTTIKVKTTNEGEVNLNTTPVPTVVQIVTPKASVYPTVTTQRVRFISPTLIPVEKKVPSQSPTIIKTPTSTIKLTLSSPTGLNMMQDYIMKAINDYRKSKGLGGVKTSFETCSFAKIRAKEISISFNHEGFRNRLTKGTLPYESWTLVTENLAQTSNYKNVVSMWIASSSHAENMRKDTLYVCVENYGNYYAYEGMRP